MLFSGSLRFNIDPFDSFRDDHIWATLEAAHLKDFVSRLKGGLEYQCGEGGRNLRWVVSLVLEETWSRPFFLMLLFLR